MLQSRELPARVATAPLLLSAEKPDSELRLLVADADGFVHLLRGEQLTMARSWRLNGKITSGPYLLGQRVGCIVDERRLVCLDPDQPEAVWTYARPNADIVGQPQLVGDLLVVADSQGGVLALNPATGQPLGARLQDPGPGSARRSPRGLRGGGPLRAAHRRHRAAVAPDRDQPESRSTKSEVGRTRTQSV